MVEEGIAQSRGLAGEKDAPAASWWRSPSCSSVDSGHGTEADAISGGEVACDPGGRAASRRCRLVPRWGAARRRKSQRGSEPAVRPGCGWKLVPAASYPRAPRTPARCARVRQEGAAAAPGDEATVFSHEMLPRSSAAEEQEMLSTTVTFATVDNSMTAHDTAGAVLEVSEDARIKALTYEIPEWMASTVTSMSDGGLEVERILSGGGYQDSAWQSDFDVEVPGHRPAAPAVGRGTRFFLLDWAESLNMDDVSPPPERRQRPASDPTVPTARSPSEVLRLPSVARVTSAPVQDVTPRPPAQHRRSKSDIGPGAIPSRIGLPDIFRGRRVCSRGRPGSVLTSPPCHHAQGTW
mmetsp:Transcript_87191/g.224548  ORF Transcript_87191/g.224548 Transcript_87191/m.224548 type:complete len:351 (+) Transcript_87191:203-1255(+)